MSTSPLLEEASAYYKALLRSVFEGRRFLLTGNYPASLGHQARYLRGFGAARPFLIAERRGNGGAPEPKDAELRVLDVHPGADRLDHDRKVQRALADPPREIQRAVDAWDPEGAARTLHQYLMAGAWPVAGRAAYAGRPAEWIALEDKVAIDAFWDVAGVPRAPSRVVRAEHQALRAAADALDRGAGTVWASDAGTVRTAGPSACAGCVPATTDARRRRPWPASPTAFASCLSWRGFPRASTASCSRTLSSLSGPSRCWCFARETATG